MSSRGVIVEAVHLNTYFMFVNKSIRLLTRSFRTYLRHLVLTISSSNVGCNTAVPHRLKLCCTLTSHDMCYCQSYRRYIPCSCSPRSGQDSRESRGSSTHDVLVLPYRRVVPCFRQTNDVVRSTDSCMRRRQPTYPAPRVS